MKQPRQERQLPMEGPAFYSQVPGQVTDSFTEFGH